METFGHVPVMLREVIEGLDIKENGVYLDCTLGGGGHSEEIVKKLTGGRLIAIDRDEEALKAAGERLAHYKDKITYVHGDYKEEADKLGELDGILIDMGLSSHQIDSDRRGFSYKNDSPLDMRMDQSQSFSAIDVVNGYGEEELANVIFRYGEERYSRRIAAAIARERAVKPIDTTGRLAEIITRSIPPKDRYSGGNPAKKSFQAIRIEVNGELEGLYEALIRIARKLKPGGRMCVIAFHSLEDRAVKQAFRYLECDCVCPPEVMRCTCGKVTEVKIITKKPMTPTEEEAKANKRSESAKLRIIEKL